MKEYVNQSMKGPIIDNRIVNDRTFAIRLYNFVKEVQVNDALSKKEKAYILNVARNLIKLQIDTCQEDDEFDYLENIKEIINKVFN